MSAAAASGQEAVLQLRAQVRPECTTRSHRAVPRLAICAVRADVRDYGQRSAGT